MLRDCPTNAAGSGHASLSLAGISAQAIDWVLSSDATVNERLDALHQKDIGLEVKLHVLTAQVSRRNRAEAIRGSLRVWFR